MKTLKINLSLFVLLFVIGSTTVFGQQENDDKKKKVIIITKTIDENGNETTEKIVKDISDENVFFIDESEGSHDLFQDQIKVEVDAANIENKMKLKIIKGDGTDDVDFFEWNGDSEMPADLIKELKEKGINMEVEGDHNIFHFKRDNDAPNSACLGVVIGQTKKVENINGDQTEIVEGTSEHGVSVLGIITDSGAEDAGLAKEDVITAINGTVVSSIGDVIGLLAPYEAGTDVIVAYLRDGQNSETTATLKACSNANVEEIKEKVEWVEDGKQSVNIRKVIIKKHKEGELATIEEVVEGEPANEDFDFSPEVTQVLDLEDFEVFPNPTDGQLTLQFTAPVVPTTIKIVDISGREVYKEQLNNFDGIYNQELDLSDVAKGTLILSVYQGDKVFSEKIILH